MTKCLGRGQKASFQETEVAVLIEERFWITLKREETTEKKELL